MVLTLEISGPEAAKLGGTSRKVFNARGGTIGRVATNDWVLPDGYVSSRHARIQYQDDTYYLIDESKNGVCINSPDNHLRTRPPVRAPDRRLDPDRSVRDPRVDCRGGDGARNSSIKPPVGYASATGGALADRSVRRGRSVWRLSATAAVERRFFRRGRRVRFASGRRSRSPQPAGCDPGARPLTTPRGRPIWRAARSSTSITVRR